MSGRSEKWELDVCVGCTTFSPEGELSFIQGGECGISVVKVGSLYLNEAEPELARRVKHCAGPEDLEVPRSGILGYFGAKKTVKICPAVTDADLSKIFKDQLDWHNQLKLAERSEG